MEFRADEALREGAVLSVRREDVAGWTAPVLFTPPLQWAVLSLSFLGVKRLSVVCEDQVWDELGHLLPPHARRVRPGEETPAGAVLDRPALYLPDREIVPLDSATLRAYAAMAAKRAVNGYWLGRGVELLDPENTYIAPTVSIAPGAVILPGTILRGDTRIGPGCEIGPNAVLIDVTVGEGSVVNASQASQSSIGCHTTVGPFAYIRPGSQIGDRVKIGDFVEIKNSVIGRGTKVSHLTYVGDSDVGEGVNFGCGTVTVNYDGAKKFRTRIGHRAFIGCNTNLVAPVTVGDGSYIAAGSTITREVPADSLAIARAYQTVKVGWAKKKREG